MEELDFDKEEIETCLNCIRPRCNNCYDRIYRNKRNHKIVLDADVFVGLYNAGFTASKMALKLKLHRDTLERRLQEYGIFLQIPRPKLDKAYFEALPEDQRRFIAWEGVLMA